MSKRETRIAKAWLLHYARKEAGPQRGVIVFGAGLDFGNAMNEASAAGYYVKHCGIYAELY